MGAGAYLFKPVDQASILVSKYVFRDPLLPLASDADRDIPCSSVFLASFKGPMYSSVHTLLADPFKW
jgi:hypothetical protein